MNNNNDFIIFYFNSIYNHQLCTPQHQALSSYPTMMVGVDYPWIRTVPSPNTTKILLEINLCCLILLKCIWEVEEIQLTQNIFSLANYNYLDWSIVLIHSSTAHWLPSWWCFCIDLIDCLWWYVLGYSVRCWDGRLPIEGGMLSVRIPCWHNIND